MFGNLHKINKQNKPKNRSYKETYAQRNLTQLKSKEHSYSQMHQKKKQNKSWVVSHELIECQAFMFEGICNQEIKNGEGVMFLKNGHILMGKWSDDILNGRVLIFTSFGGIISAQFLNGKLNGWVISKYQNKIVCATLYFENSIDSQRIIFEAQESLWVASKYSADGKFLKISHVQKGDLHTLPYFIDSEELEHLYDHFIINRNYVQGFKTIQETAINQSTKFIGFLNQDGLPNGLGCMFSREEMFFGMFAEGVLHDFGRMIFRNGQLYQGFVHEGSFRNQGIYYSPNKNQTIFINSKQNSPAQIIDEFKGYLLVDFQTQLGLKTLNKNTGINMTGLKYQIQQIQKYYSQWHIQSKIKDNNELSIRENYSEQPSEMLYDNSVNSPMSPPIKKKQSIQKQWSLPKNKWIQGMSGESEEQFINDSFKKTHSITKWDRALNRKTPEHKRPDPKIRHLVTFKSEHDNNYASIPIKENEIESQKESYEKKSPRNLSKKNSKFHESQSQSMRIEGSTLFEIKKVQLTTPKNFTQSPQSRNSEQKKIEDLGFNNREFAPINYSPSSSNISNMSYKLDGIMKKSVATKRKRIFQQQ